MSSGRIHTRPRLRTWERKGVSEPPIGIEPMTFSLRVNRPGSTRLHRSPLNCGNALSERLYDGGGGVSTTTELHHSHPPPTSSMVAMWTALGGCANSATPRSSATVFFYSGRRPSATRRTISSRSWYGDHA